ncbi:MAG TPA: ATP-binding protein, partial [Rhodanobacter sp.]|nr:ATP-binding protein [Rhodanobacter sp.]
MARDTLNSLTVAAGAVAASIDIPLEHFADMSDSIRASDLQGDKIALTSRLLRLQAAVPPSAAAFAVNASGQLLASSSPFAAADASVGDTDWFRRATADNGMALSLQRSDSWLRGGMSLLLTKIVRDAAGKPAGLVGALFRFDDLARMIGHTWLGPGVSIELRGVDGPLLLSAQPATGPSPATESRSDTDWGSELLAIANRVLGVPVQLTVAAPLHSVDATVSASIGTDVALKTHWLGTRAVSILGAYLLAVWLSCIALAVSVRAKGEGSVPSPIGFGADWEVELDRRGCVRTVHGFAPDQLRDAVGQPLLTALGLVPSQAAGQRVAEAMDAHSFQDNIQVALSGEEGADRVHRLRIEPLPDGRYVCAGRDVTLEVELLAKLQSATSDCAAAQEQAAMVARDRDRVLAALGHDVRTPMNSVMGICSLLLDSELEQEQRLWLERIRASCDALLAMLNGLLEIASGEVGGAGLQTDEVDVIGLVREVTDTLQPQARDKGLELKTRYDDLLRGHWLIDPARMRQVLFNLVGNAIKFTHHGHVEVRASAVAGSSDTPCIKLAVSDTGPGIAPEDRDLIFERFRRGHDQENGAHPGLGLGLALCRENAILMGGTLTVESALGVGSEF